jgi:hypothetical protein
MVQSQELCARSYTRSYICLNLSNYCPTCSSGLKFQYALKSSGRGFTLSKCKRDVKIPSSGTATLEPGGEGLLEPGERGEGELYILDRTWNEAGSQDLFLVIREGIAGGRNSKLPAKTTL